MTIGARMRGKGKRAQRPVLRPFAYSRGSAAQDLSASLVAGDEDNAASNARQLIVAHVVSAA